MAQGFFHMVGWTKWRGRDSRQPITFLHNVGWEFRRGRDWKALTWYRVSDICFLNLSLNLT